MNERGYWQDRVEASRRSLEYAKKQLGRVSLENLEGTPCDESVPCGLRETTGCFEDVHHKYFPRRSYRTPLEKEFRELPENKVVICRQLHNDEHATIEPPDKPPISEMRQRVNSARLGKVLDK